LSVAKPSTPETLNPGRPSLSGQPGVAPCFAAHVGVLPSNARSRVEASTTAARCPHSTSPGGLPHPCLCRVMLASLLRCLPQPASWAGWSDTAARPLPVASRPEARLPLQQGGQAYLTPWAVSLHAARGLALSEAARCLAVCCKARPTSAYRRAPLCGSRRPVHCIADRVRAGQRGVILAALLHGDPCPGLASLYASPGNAISRPMSLKACSSKAERRRVNCFDPCPAPRCAVVGHLGPVQIAAMPVAVSRYRAWQSARLVPSRAQAGLLDVKRSLLFSWKACSAGAFPPCPPCPSGLAVRQPGKCPL
jgi:hypothetical protein